jgi:small ligand-binding sensory domain FIST
MEETQTNRMKWASALSTRASLEAALNEAIEQAEQQLDGSASLALIFISSAFASEYSRLMPLLREKLKSQPQVIGCSGGGIVGMTPDGKAQEIEGKPAISLTLAYLPGVEVQTFHVSAAALPDLDSPQADWVDLLGVPQANQPQFVLLADPLTARINDLLQGLDFAYSGSVKIGGLASGGVSASSVALFCNDQIYREGTVGVALMGNIVISTIVAQGCRPIGEPLRVVSGDRNIVTELESASGAGTSQSPLAVLQELIENLSEGDRELAQHSLFVGVVRDEFKEALAPGDFLIRNLLGVDPRSGAIAIGDRVRTGQRIQFHLRDAKTSAEDLEMLLLHYEQQKFKSNEVGALMFSCLGRGEYLYGQPNFDSGLFHKYLSNLPLSGFFCNGEIGPVGGSTFLHGYTSVFGICRQP